jgi:hypothetical protein
MVKRLLSVLLVVLLAVVVTGKVRSARLGRGLPATSVARGSGPRELTLSPGESSRAHSVVPDLPEGLGTPDSLVRAGARVLLTGELERHYLDSLFAGVDSTIRRWPSGSDPIALAILPGGPEGFAPEMVSEVREALDRWSPGAVGLRFLEQADTVGAQMIVRWTDTLEADRAGATDVTWDKAGRVHRVTVYLAVRSPTTGRPFTPSARRAIALHELGHALGLPHSSHSSDVMYPVATTTTLTERDRFSLRLLYELPTGWVGTPTKSQPR